MNASDARADSAMVTYIKSKCHMFEYSHMSDTNQYFVNSLLSIGTSMLGNFNMSFSSWTTFIKIEKCLKWTIIDFSF